jgi:hypothetical protein
MSSFKMQAFYVKLSLFILLSFPTNTKSIEREFCDKTYFDAIIWSGIDYYLRRNINENSLKRWIVNFKKSDNKFYVKGIKTFNCK